MCGVMLSGSEESTPSIVYHCVLRGLERLLLSEQLSRLDAESLVKLSVDRVNAHSPHRAMAALGLMLTCMYTGERGPAGAQQASAAHPRRSGGSPQAPVALQVAELGGCQRLMGSGLQADQWALCDWARPWAACWGPPSPGFRPSLGVQETVREFQALLTEPLWFGCQ